MRTFCRKADSRQELCDGLLYAGNVLYILKIFTSRENRTFSEENGEFPGDSFKYVYTNDEPSLLS
jgi:hypothetical protein